MHFNIKQMKYSGKIDSNTIIVNHFSSKFYGEKLHVSSIKEQDGVNIN